MKIQSIINKLLLRDPYFISQKCYGQNGEDLVLDRLLEHQVDGFFVDIGAHHPVRFSNTYLFYLRGWRGLNIDAQPGSMEAFNRHRPRDINIESGVAKHSGSLNYYQFNEPALNTFDSDEAKLKNVPPYKIINELGVKVERLDKILETHLPAGQKVDFMSIDVEGKDLEVLESNDWKLCRPRFVLAETLRMDMLRISECPVAKFMCDMGYKPIAKVYDTIFFEREKSE